MNGKGKCFSSVGQGEETLFYMNSQWLPVPTASLFYSMNLACSFSWPSLPLFGQSCYCLTLFHYQRELLFHSLQPIWRSSGKVLKLRHATD